MAIVFLSPITAQAYLRGTWGIAVLMFFFDAVNKISICGVAVISNLTVCDGDGVSSTFLAVMRCT